MEWTKNIVHRFTETKDDKRSRIETVSTHSLSANKIYSQISGAWNNNNTISMSGYPKNSNSNISVLKPVSVLMMSRRPSNTELSVAGQSATARSTYFPGNVRMKISKNKRLSSFGRETLGVTSSEAFELQVAAPVSRIRAFSSTLIPDNMVSDILDISSLITQMSFLNVDDRLPVDTCDPGFQSQINTLFSIPSGSILQDSEARTRVLVTHVDVPQIIIDFLEQDYDVVFIGPNDDWKTQRNKIKMADAIFLAGNYFVLDEEIVSFSRNDKLKVVSTMNHNFDNMDIAELVKKGVRIGIARDVTVDSIAELAVGLAIAVNYNFNEFFHMKNLGNGDDSNKCINALFGSVCGIIGQQEMANVIATKLKKFRIKEILFSNPGGHVQKTINENICSKAKLQDSIKEVDFKDLVKMSDFIFVMCPLTRETKYLFNKKVFKKMKSSVIFIDVSSKGVVNSNDLLAALQKKYIRGAGVDVTYPELPRNHPLLILKNCLVTPEIASATKKTRLVMAKLTADNIVAGINNLNMPKEVCFKKSVLKTEMKNVANKLKKYTPSRSTAAYKINSFINKGEIRSNVYMH